VNNLAIKKKSSPGRRERKGEKSKATIQIHLSPEDAALHNAVAVASARDFLALAK
jgi:hypothetical protein